jgi:hypothetical protein
MRDPDGGVIRDVVDVVRAVQTTCVIFDGGAMGCAGNTFPLPSWGFQRDAGRNVFSVDEVWLLNASGVEAASGGNRFLCVASGGALACGGEDDQGRLGTGLPSGVTAMASGFDFSVVVSGTGINAQVVAWGSSDNGQLGLLLGAQTDGLIWRAEALPVPGTQGARGVAADDHFACAVFQAGGVKCWGKGGPWLGHEDGLVEGTYDQHSAQPVRRSDGTPFSGATAVAAGYEHACALLTDHSIWCWGEHNYGAMGIYEGYENRPRPVRANDLGSWVGVTAGAWHTCAVDACGQVHCWGRNMFKALGTDQIPDNGQAEPFRVPFPHVN